MSVVLILLIVLGIVIIVFICKALSLWGQARDTLQQVFGTSDIKKLRADGKRQAAVTPKSISSMTSLCLPQIQADFPEFNWPEFRNKCQNVLTAALLARSEHKMSYLEGIEGDLVHQVELVIKEDELAGEQHSYHDIDIHKTEITDYRKRDGLCIITTQSAVGHIRWCEQNGQLISGDKDFATQTKYDLDLVYVQDPDQVRSGDLALGVTCPNCGGVISSLGEKECAYCGSAIEPINIRVWRFGALHEDDK